MRLLAYSEAEIKAELDDKYHPHLIPWEIRDTFAAWQLWAVDMLPGGMDGRPNYAPVLHWLDWRWRKPAKRMVAFWELRVVAGAAYQRRKETERRGSNT